MSDDKPYWLEIRKFDGTFTHRVGSYADERARDRAERGALMNLDTERYYVATGQDA